MKQSTYANQNPLLHQLFLRPTRHPFRLPELFRLGLPIRRNRALLRAHREHRLSPANVGGLYRSRSGFFGAGRIIAPHRRCQKQG